MPNRVAGQEPGSIGVRCHPTAIFDVKTLMSDQASINENLRACLQAFLPEVRGIFERFELPSQIDKLVKSGLLYLIAEKFAAIDLYLDALSSAVDDIKDRAWRQK
jgi:type I restriction enzyme M protein